MEAPVYTASTTLDEPARHAVADLMERAWPGFGPMFHQEMVIYQTYPDVFEPYFVTATRDGRIAGFAFLMASTMTMDLDCLTWVAVDEADRGQGIGRQVVDICRAESRRRNRKTILTTAVPDFYDRIGSELSYSYKEGESRFLVVL